MNKAKHNIPYLKEYRKELRNHGTPAEAILWNALKGKQLQGRKFRRQHSLNNYIVDFYCPTEKLIVEVDGIIHDEISQADADFGRDQELAKMGFKVVRFRNADVFDQVESVLNEIASYFAK